MGDGGLNVILNVLTVVGLVAIMVAAVPFIRSRRKDGMIMELQKALEVSEAFVKQKERECVGVSARAERLERERNEAKEEAAACKARYDELSQYTARPAFEQVIRELAGIKTVIETTSQASNDLMLKNLEVLAKIEVNNQKGVEK
jgi:Tfp pilus assembly protein PilX